MPFLLIDVVCLRSVEIVASSEKVSAMRRQCRNCLTLHPGPYSEVKCFEIVSMICCPYSARCSWRTSCRIRQPICQYSKVSSAFTATAARCRAELMSCLRSVTSALWVFSMSLSKFKLLLLPTVQDTNNHTLNRIHLVRFADCHKQSNRGQGFIADYWIPCITI